MAYPGCQSAARAAAPSLSGEHVRIEQKIVFWCACAGLVPLGEVRLSLEMEKCLRWGTVCHVVVCGRW